MGKKMSIEELKEMIAKLEKDNVAYVALKGKESYEGLYELSLDFLDKDNKEIKSEYLYYS